MKRMQCPNCQSWINQDDASCSFCGHALSQSASISPSIAAQQPNTPPPIIRAAPQPTQPASSQPVPPNLPPPPLVSLSEPPVSTPPALVSPSKQPISASPPQIGTVPPLQQTAQFSGKKEKGGSCFKIGCGIISLLGICLLVSVGVMYGFAIAGYNALVPDVLPFELLWIDQSPLEIENYLDDSICYLNVSASDSTDWGLDLLGTSDIIAPEYAYTVYVVPDQKYDIQILDCDENELDTVEGVKIGTGGYTYSPGSE